MRAASYSDTSGSVECAPASVWERAVVIGAMVLMLVWMSSAFVPPDLSGFVKRYEIQRLAGEVDQVGRANYESLEKEITELRAKIKKMETEGNV